MSLDPFKRSLTSIRGDGFSTQLLVLGLAIVIFGGWLAWFLFAEIPVYEITATGRIEVVDSAHHIEAPATGKVTSVKVALGATIEAGAVLIELDATAEKLDAAEQRALLDSFDSQRTTLLREIAAAESTLAEATRALPVAIEEAKARQAATQLAARNSRANADSTARMARAGVVARNDARDALAKARESTATAAAAGHEVQRIELELKGKLGEQQVRIETLKRSLAAITGQLETGKVKLRRLENEVERRTLRAPVRGTIGEVAHLPIGAQVKQGDRLATIVPDGALRMVGDFTPRVLGRIQPGQSAVLRAQAFPSTQYGSIRATVQHVASEVRDGVLRVELELVPDPDSAIPRQHGLPGVIEVEVERVSPATLVGRALGRGVESR